MKRHCFLQSILLIVSVAACTTAQKKQMNKQEKIQTELTTLNHLLRDSSLAIAIAATQDSAYYTALKKTMPAFDAAKNETIAKSVKEEKIATSIGCFYALECGIGVLTAQKGNTPVYWLKKIINKELDAAELLLLNRFANATWKAAQPFRSLQRITRDNFMVASFLSAAEIQKDHDQVLAAAVKLLAAITAVADQSKEEQLKKISQLMQDKTFALEMAAHLEAAYYSDLNKPVPPFLTPEDDTALKMKNLFEEKVATNLAGFYALECGLAYLADAEQKLPSAIVQSILDGTINKQDKELLERFANATWKAGQPFRSLDRISKDNFTPFYFLSGEEVEKDWVQISTVAKRLITLL